MCFSYAVSPMDFTYVVSCRSNPPPAEIRNLCKWTCWGNSGSVFCCNTGVPNRRGVGTCWERKQGSHGEAYHTMPPSFVDMWNLTPLSKAPLPVVVSSLTSTSPSLTMNENSTFVEYHRVL
ncbi:hypothetical protein BHM03_00047982 [Ensete ventricosum]|nr:hypothetical protein BHM03_00047982 [Ensete ventricosum]